MNADIRRIHAINPRLSLHQSAFICVSGVFETASGTSRARKPLSCRGKSAAPGFRPAAASAEVIEQAAQGRGHRLAAYRLAVAAEDVARAFRLALLPGPGETDGADRLLRGAAGGAGDTGDGERDLGVGMGERALGHGARGRLA